MTTERHPAMRLRIVELPSDGLSSAESTPFLLLIDRCTLPVLELEQLATQLAAAREATGARGALIFPYDVELC